MKIITYETDNGDIYRNPNICDSYKTYLTNGMGCDTIWFRDKKTAHKALMADGVKTGHDFDLCDKCQCHFSINDPNWKKYKPYVCKKAKIEYAKKFENGSN